MKPGDILDGKYRIEAELGRGSFGAVYRAVQTNIERQVAIKVLTPKGKLDDEMQQRFKREAKLSSHLNSPHSIKIHDYGETDGKYYIVMEYLQGQPLDSLLRLTGPMPPKRVAKLIKQVLESLGEAHQKGIIHRDLKPDNIFVCNAPQADFVKVFDFGIAKVVGGAEPGSLKETQKLTMVGGTVGTPAYMSPEQCCGEKLTAASDFYSLGIVMYEMLTGILPFEDPNPVRTMMRQINEMPPELSAEVKATAVGRATWRALAKRPEDRFQNAQDFIDALAEHEATAEGPTSGMLPLNPTPPSMTSPSSEGTMPVLPASMPPSVSGSLVAPSSGDSKRSLIWGVVIGAIAVVLLIAVLLIVLSFVIKS